MNDPVLQLTYISSRHPRMAPSEIEWILSNSRFNNRQNGITGLLLYNGHRFLQHIEGPTEAVEATYARISRDQRHRGIVMLGRKESEFRAFSSWSMAFERVDSASPERRRALVAQVQEMVASVDPRIGDHFLGYARLTTRAA